MAGWRSSLKEKDLIKWEGTLEAKKFSGDGSALTNLAVGSETDPVWTADKPTYDTHISDTTIHFTSGALWTAVNLNTAKVTYDDAVLVAANVASTALNTTHRGLTNNPHSVTLGQVGGTTDHTALSNIGTRTHAQLEASAALINPHIADSAIHFTSGAITAHIADNTIHFTSGAITSHIADSTLHFTSGALWTAINANTASSAVIGPHINDTSDPHGTLLTQTHITLSGVASSAQVNITADNTTASVAMVRNIVLGTSATPASAALFTRGTLYVQYTA